MRGFILVETVVALAIVGTAILATLAATSTASISSNSLSLRATAGWVATSQVEFIQNETYVATPGTYPAVTAPPGFVVENTTEAVPGGDSNVQLVRVTVSKDGKQLVETETVKVNR